MLVYRLIMSLAERLSSKFHIRPRSFASRPNVHFSDNLSVADIISRYTSRWKGFIYLISCHFLNQLESKVTSNSCALSEYANYLSPWLKNTINSQYFWWLWSSPDHLTEGFAVKVNTMLFLALTWIGFAHGNRSYRVPCPTGTFVPPLKRYKPSNVLELKCIPCPPGEFPWRVIWRYNVSIFYFI